MVPGPASLIKMVLPIGRRGLVAAATALVALGLVVVFGRELASLSAIVFSRAAEKAQAVLLPAILDRPYDEIVDSKTAEAVEIEQYLEELEQPAARTPEALGLDLSSVAAYERSSSELRARLATSLGYPPQAPAPLTNAPTLVQFAEDALATYSDFSVPVFAGVRARGVFMMPRTAGEKTPLIIAVHGRGGMPERPRNGKLTVVGRSNRDLALGALEKGYAVWEPQLVFYAKDRPADIRERLDMRARQYGTTLPAIEIAKIRRGLTALLDTGRIDPTRVAMVGMSYGGFYTLYTTALDDRIRVAVVAAYFNDRKAILDATEPFGNSDWRFPNSLSVFQDATVASLICPRPLQVQAGDHDQLFPIAGARRAIPGARVPYARLKIEDRFSFVEFAGRHDFNGDAAWSFIERAFK